MIVFTTFTSTGYEAARDRITSEVRACGRFNAVFTYNETQLTPELLASPTFKIKKGLGHYSWKPDIIWQTLKKVNDGDIVVYLDAGCKINNNQQWDKFFSFLDVYDIVAFLLHQRNYEWTRKSVFDHFSKDIEGNWKECYQFGANALILKKTESSMKFISDWRYYMINRLDLCGDVPEEELSEEDSRLIENRYDQTILTALLYKYSKTGKVKTLWEHFEGYDLFRNQAFMASRLRKEDSQNGSFKFKNILFCLIKQYLYYPIIGNYYKNKFSTLK